MNGHVWLVATLYFNTENTVSKIKKIKYSLDWHHSSLEMTKY